MGLRVSIGGHLEWLGEDGTLLGVSGALGIGHEGNPFRDRLTGPLHRLERMESVNDHVDDADNQHLHDGKG